MHDAFMTMNKITEDLAAYHVGNMTDAEIAEELENRRRLNF